MVRGWARYFAGVEIRADLGTKRESGQISCASREGFARLSSVSQAGVIRAKGRALRCAEAALDAGCAGLEVPTVPVGALSLSHPEYDPFYALPQEPIGARWAQDLNPSKQTGGPRSKPSRLMLAEPLSLALPVARTLACQPM